MKMRFNGLIAVAALAFTGLAASPARAALTLRLFDGVTPIVISCVGTATSQSCSALDANYSVILTTGIDNSPGGPATLTKTLNVTALSGAVGAANALTFEASDTGFMLPSGSATLTETLNGNSPVGTTTTATGSATAIGYLSNTNTLFDVPGSANTGTASIGTFLVGANDTTSTATSFTTPFALDEIMTVTFTSAGFAAFTATLAATETPVPEPASVMLLGGVLLFVARAARRRRVART